MDSRSAIRIAYVIDTVESPAGGTERQLLALLNGLDRQEFTPRLVCLRGSPWLRSVNLNLPVTVYGGASSFAPAFIRDLLKFRDLCWQERIHIVQTFFVDGNIFGTVGARLARSPIVVSSRRNAGHWHDRRQVLFLRGLRYWTDWYLANSQVAAQSTIQVEKVDPGRVKVIANGLDVDQLTTEQPEARARQRAAWGVGPDDVLIGYVANLRSVKNIPEYARAAVQLAIHEPRCRFVVVGEGPERPQLEALVRTLGLGERFHLVGRLLDIRPALRAFDLAVQCSRAESSSNSLLECMAVGLPVVASDVPGNHETLVHEVNGLLYPLGRPERLAEALRRLMLDRAFARRLGAAAAEQVRARHSMAAMLAGHAAFYRHIAQGVGHT